MEFQNQNLQKQYKERVKAIQDLINKPVDDTKYLWDATAKKYAVKIEKIERILDEKEIKGDIPRQIRNRMESFLDRCQHPEFQIALVGTIKAGKSTLINALLGEELASTKVTPETASLTKFKGAKHDYVEVTFYTPEEWNRLWKSVEKAHAKIFMEEYNELHGNQEKDKWLGKGTKTFDCDTREKLKEEITRWTSAKSATHYFVKEVVVGVKDFDLPEGVVLVDTPGLDDVVQYRSDITRHYIDRANAVLVCVKSDKMEGSDFDTIARVFINSRNDRAKIFIVGTQIDNLNNPNSDWDKQKKEWMKHLKGDSCYGDAQLAKSNLVAVSAYLYTLLNKYKDDKLDKNSDEYFTFVSAILKLRIRESEVDEKFTQIREFTNIDNFRAKINTELVENSKRILVEDINNQYSYVREDLLKTLGGIEAAQNEIIETAKKGREAIESKRKEYEQKVDKAKEDSQSLERMVDKMKRVTQKRADDLLNAIRGMKVE